MAKKDIMINKCEGSETSENKITDRMLLKRTIIIVEMLFYLHESYGLFY